MLRYFRIWRRLFALEFATVTTYRANFLMQLSSVVMDITLTVVFARVVYAHVPAIAGWDFDHLLLLLGTYMIVDGIAWLTYKGGMQEIDDRIRKGSLDAILTKPADAQFLTTIARIDLEDSARIVAGTVLLFKGISAVQPPHLAATIPLYLLLVALATIIFYSLRLLVKIPSFWSTKGWGVNAVAFNLFRLAQYPTDIYKGFARIVYTFLLPIVFVATVPARTLSGVFDWRYIFGALIIAAIFFTISRKTWLWALTRYASASS